MNWKRGWTQFLAGILVLLCWAGAFAEEADAWLGRWRLTEVEVFGIRLPAAVLGLEAQLVLRPEGVCDMADGDGTVRELWQETDTGIRVGEKQLTLTENGQLVADAGMVQMLFTREKEEPAAAPERPDAPMGPAYTPAPTHAAPLAPVSTPLPTVMPTPTPVLIPDLTALPTAAPVPLPTAEPTAIPEGACIGMKFLCTRAEMAGVAVDPALLGGEYSVLLRKDGSAVLTLAGMEIRNLKWTASGHDFVIRYYGTDLRLERTPEGLRMQYMDGMVLILTPVQ